VSFAGIQDETALERGREGLEFMASHTVGSFVPGPRCCKLLFALNPRDAALMAIMDATLHPMIALLQSNWLASVVATSITRAPECNQRAIETGRPRRSPALQKGMFGYGEATAFIAQSAGCCALAP
jgi:hypothetical protein